MHVTSDALVKAYADGREKAAFARTLSYDKLIPEQFAGIRASYPPLRDMNFDEALLRFDGERMANPPDPARFPEAQGAVDLLVEERRGFLDECGDMLFLAFYYSWMYYYTRRINTRFLPDLPNKANQGCTAVYIPNSTEGGPLFGRNWDVTLTPWTRALMEPPREASDGKRVMWTKGVSCSVFLDEEPAEIFPLDPWTLLPAECTGDAVAAAEFLYRYRDFWGPTNCILVDTNHDSVAIEKANVRMGVRKSSGGASAVTALQYQIPEMHAYKDERNRKSIALRGMALEEAPDWEYWQGASRRYDRLLELTAEANRRGASLWDMAHIATDHAVPPPARVCIAGEFHHPAIPPGNEEWTAVSHSEVLEGPNRRMLFFVVEDGKPCYDTPPYLVPGPGVAMRPEWMEGTRPLPAEFTNPRPRIHAEYPNARMYL